jgi:F0F1-type ATP synthase membrane subunit b/b'
MNNLELLKSQLNDINTKRVRIQTLVEQAQKQCEEIEKKYNVSSLEELKVLVDKAELEYRNQVQEAQKYIQETNQVLSTYQGIL